MDRPHKTNWQEWDFKNDVNVTDTHHV